MALRNRLGGHSNSYHTYSLEEALEGIAAAGYKFVELSACAAGPSTSRSRLTPKRSAAYSG
jgi:sugar phosphate isomerase/epimerase